MGFVHAFQVLVPAGAIKEKTMHVASVLWSLGEIVFLAVLGDHKEVEGQRVDWVLILSKKLITFLA